MLYNVSLDTGREEEVYQFWNHGSISYGRRTNLGAFYVTAPDALLTIIPIMKEWPKPLNQFRKEIIDP